VVIPAYNEERNIAGVIESVKRSAPGLDIIVVDDGSEDRTADIAGDAGAKVLSLPFHMGYGSAVQTGYKYALRRGYDYVVQMDADGQHEPVFISDFLRELKGGTADAVIGSRFLKSGRAVEGGRRRYRATFSRRIGMFLFGLITSLAIGRRITDPTSGYLGLNRRALQALSTEAYPVDYPDADVIVMLHRSGLTVREIPVIMYENSTGGKLHRGISPVYYVFKMSLSTFIAMLRKG